MARHLNISWPGLLPEQDFFQFSIGFRVKTWVNWLVVYMFLCLLVCMFLCLFVSLCVCVCMFFYISMYVVVLCMCICIHVGIFVSLGFYVKVLFLRIIEKREPNFEASFWKIKSVYDTREIDKVKVNIILVDVES